MAHAESFRWDQLPNPDFSQVGQWFFRFPQELRNMLNRSEEQTVIGVMFFSWVAGNRAGRQTNNCSFSEEGLGQQFGRSRWTVARALETLERMELIRRIHRRPKPGGIWQTNLYILQPKLLRLLSVIIKAIYGKIPCSRSAPEVALKHTKGETTSSFQSSSPQKKETPDENDSDREASLAFLKRVGAL